MDILLFNPHAGSIAKSGLTAECLMQMLRDRGIQVALPCCDTKERMLEAVANADARIIVAGGDGTIHPVLKAAHTCSKTTLAIIPGGSANHLATTLGIPKDIENALDIIAEGFTRTIDLGSVDGTVFSQAAGAGFHAKVFHVYGDKGEKSRIRGTAAVASVLSTYTPQLMRIIIDGESHLEDVIQVTVANTPTYGAAFTIAPDARVDDGLLDVVVLGNLSRLEIVKYGLAAVEGILHKLPKTYTTRARKVEIASATSEEVEVHADAEPVGYTPTVIEVIPHCLKVVVPRTKS